MKKIMFNDRFGLTEAVLAGRKTMTRRIMKVPENASDLGGLECRLGKLDGSDKQRAYWFEGVVNLDWSHAVTLGSVPIPYQIGEEIAIAQSYMTIMDNLSVDEEDDYTEKLCEAYGINTHQSMLDECIEMSELAGINNKMFVKPELMPHRIKITNIEIERLQDISDEDCLREGITIITEGKIEIGNAYGWDTKVDALKRDSFFTPRAAFAALIDKVSRRDTWDSNPWVFAYEFQLI